MRIITGTARGTKLVTLEGEKTRPTLERTKEAMFSSVQFDIEGRFVLDLFAGSGQLGLEALSRGAEKAVLCDVNAEAVDVIRQNALKTHLYKKCSILKYDYAEYIRAAAVSKHKFDLVFLDPPYGTGLLESTLDKLAKSDVLAPHAIIIAESNKSIALDGGLDEFYVLEKEYKAGKTYFSKLSPKING